MTEASRTLSTFDLAAAERLAARYSAEQFIHESFTQRMDRIEREREERQRMANEVQRRMLTGAQWPTYNSTRDEMQYREAERRRAEQLREAQRRATLAFQADLTREMNEMRRYEIYDETVYIPERPTRYMTVTPEPAHPSPHSADTAERLEAQRRDREARIAQFRTDYSPTGRRRNRP